MRTQCSLFRGSFTMKIFIILNFVCEIRFEHKLIKSFDIKYFGSLWPGGVVQLTILSRGQINMFKNQSDSIMMCTKTNKHTNKNKTFQKQLQTYKYEYTMNALPKYFGMK